MRSGGWGSGVEITSRAALKGDPMTCRPSTLKAIASSNGPGACWFGFRVFSLGDGVQDFGCRTEGLGSGCRARGLEFRGCD